MNRLAYTRGLPRDRFRQWAFTLETDFTQPKWPIPLLNTLGYLLKRHDETRHNQIMAAKSAPIALWLLAHNATESALNDSIYYASASLRYLAHLERSYADHPQGKAFAEIHTAFRQQRHAEGFTRLKQLIAHPIDDRARDLSAPAAAYVAANWSMALGVWEAAVETASSGERACHIEQHGNVCLYLRDIRLRALTRLGHWNEIHPQIAELVTELHQRNTGASDRIRATSLSRLIADRHVLNAQWEQAYAAMATTVAKLQESPDEHDGSLLYLLMETALIPLLDPDGDLDKARTLLAQAQSEMLKLEKPDPIHEVRNLMLFGRLETQREAPQSAIKFFQAALAQSRKSLSQDKAINAWIRVYLSVAQIDAGDHLGALQSLNAARSQFQRIYAKDSPAEAWIVTIMAMAHQEQGRTEEAVADALRAVEIFDKALYKNHPFSALPLTLLADLTMNQPRVNLAYVERALAAQNEKGTPEDDLERLYLQRQRAMDFFLLRNLPAAMTQIDQALTVIEKAQLGLFHRAMFRFSRALILFAQEEKTAALHMVKQSLVDIISERPGYPDLPQFINVYLDMLGSAGHDEAERLKEEEALLDAIRAQRAENAS
ncbi:tetratricopeptide repeat protein [Magnetofaba australis]|uniref:Putative kinesin light chain n=1 Tax=Magnetofaba australis IT-1 TaxID=1434232 RepID=A0A1Y2K2U7_9PROT|nr:tetratricopeptide repeat protein [Magnetofaba australis]OSM02333.1 putative kinesin light chain [Magnetofaba australis IT-1]